jgi:hypothetical protein
LPFTTNNQAPLRDAMHLFWNDNNQEVDFGGSNLFETGIAFDKVHKALMIVDRGNHRILRVKNYDSFATTNLKVDMVIGQNDKIVPGHCNHDPNQPIGNPWGTDSSVIPVADGLCTPYQAQFDTTGNMYVLENTYECHGNDRITEFSATDLTNASGLFPHLSAQRALIGGLTTKAGCFNANLPASPVSMAFTSDNKLVVGSDGYYPDDSLRQLRQLWMYDNPQTDTLPQQAITLPMGAAGDIAVATNGGRLFIQDHTWNKVWGIGVGDQPWFITINGFIPTPTPQFRPR